MYAAVLILEVLLEGTRRDQVTQCSGRAANSCSDLQVYARSAECCRKILGLSPHPKCPAHLTTCRGLAALAEEASEVSFPLDRLPWKDPLATEKQEAERSPTELLPRIEASINFVGWSELRSHCPRLFLVF